MPETAASDVHELGVRLSRDRRNVVLTMPGETGRVALLVGLEAARELRDAIDRALRLATAPEVSPVQQ
jgi:hypothetical protein